jgi:flagellar biosynthetic protein FlhB
MPEHRGEKTEQATPRRLEEAWNRGQFARSTEVQTVFVLVAGLMALLLAGHDLWRNLGYGMVSLLGHLHDIPVKVDGMPRFFIDGALVLGACVWPVAVATVVAALLAGGIQSRFRTSPEALSVNWERLNPLAGFRRLFSVRSSVPMVIAFLKLIVVLALSYNVVKSIVQDPIFYSTVDVTRIGAFLVEASFKIVLRIVFALVILAAIDYSYQFWRTNQDLMMTKEEVKDEVKNQEGDPKIKAAQRRRRQAITQRKMLAEVPRADVVLTNPTHLAIALRYDAKSMRAPKVVAKGARLNAQRIREIAQQHQVPILENKPLARLLFKYGRVGGEIPAQLYAAVAEILAYVYRVNAYRYYREQHST